MNGSHFFWYTGGMKNNRHAIVERMFGKGRSHRGFRTILFAVLILPTIAIMVLSLFLLRGALDARELDRHQTTVERDNLLVHVVARGIAIYIEAARDAVDTMAAEATGRPMTYAAMSPLTVNTAVNTKAFFGTLIAGSDGMSVAIYVPGGRTAGDRRPPGINLSDRAYYKELVATRKSVISGPISALTDQRPTFVIASPFFGKDNELVGFAVGGASLDQLYSLIQGQLDSELATPVIIDSQGKTIIHSDRDLIESHASLAELEPARRLLRGEAGFIDSFIDNDGHERSAAYAPIPGLDWGVWIARETPTDAKLFVERELQRAAVFYGFILLLNIALAYFVWRLMRALFDMRGKERAFLESIGDGVIAIDRAWKIVLWNRAAAQMTGWTELEALGYPFRERVRFMREHDRKEDLSFIEEAMLFGESRRMTNHTLLLSRDGREFPIGDSAAPLFDEDGEVKGVVIVFRDVTREKDAGMLRSDFAYASHQLRTPVNKALWTLETVLDDAKDPEVRARLSVAYHAVHDLQKLSGRLIDVSMVDQKQIVPVYEELSVSSVLKEIVAATKLDTDKYDIRLVLKSDVQDLTVDSDRKLLQSTLQEVIDNAVRYSVPGSAVEISVQIEQLNLIFRVVDHGIGIPEEQKTLVFTKFFRGLNVPQEAHGAGLGLYIAREYVRLIGGRLWFESQLGEGTAFTISIPRKPGMKD